MAYLYRRKQMLNWARTTLRQNPIRIQAEFHYQRWIKKVDEDCDNIIDAIKLATEDQLDDLYELREELRLGI